MSTNDPTIPLEELGALPDELPEPPPVELTDVSSDDVPED